MAETIILEQVDIPGRGRILRIEIPCERVESVKDVLAAKTQMEKVLQAVIRNFELKTGLPVISVHSHDEADKIHWRTTVRL